VTPGISIIRINGPLFFGNAARLAPRFLKFAKTERSRVIVLDMGASELAFPFSSASLSRSAFHLLCFDTGAVTEIDFAATANLHTALKSLSEAQGLCVLFVDVSCTRYSLGISCVALWMSGFLLHSLSRDLCRDCS
jgi:MFS superfamily sulfate permease-like transporter